jgi:hypothetical protein
MHCTLHPDTAMVWDNNKREVAVRFKNCTPVCWPDP